MLSSAQSARYLKAYRYRSCWLSLGHVTHGDELACRIPYRLTLRSASLPTEMHITAFAIRGSKYRMSKSKTAYGL